MANTVEDPQVTPDECSAPPPVHLGLTSVLGGKEAGVDAAGNAKLHRVQPRYRADIDGLRAIAIVPVVLYHAKIAPFTGGFVGVDVFFVISGYLITAMIAAEMQAETFRLVDFYVRRMRRILPALGVLLACCACVGWIILAPQDYMRLGQSIFSTALFSSNILFWRQSGYFDAAASENPLLHTWSLAVEEQFYAFFPLLLMVIWRFRPATRICLILALGAVSFCINVLSVDSHPIAAFYLAHQRIWELLLGALLALGAWPAPSSRAARNGIGMVGLVMILSGVFCYSSATRFPGLAALPPALGCLAIIWAGKSGGSVANGGLAHPVPVFVGKISYSLYLWHFPLLAFAEHLTVEMGALQRCIIVLGSVALAVISWVYVEQPVRQGSWRFRDGGAVLRMSASLLALLCAAGFGIHVTRGVPGRLSPSDLKIIAAVDDFDPDRDVCSVLDPAEVNPARLCRFGSPGSTSRFILWGDSHAEMMRPAVDVAASERGEAGLFAGRGGCAPVIGIERVGVPECLSVNKAILHYVLASPVIETAILSGRWALWAEGSRYKAERRNPVRFVAADGSAHPKDLLATGLEETVAILRGAGKRVWLVGPTPEIGYQVPQMLYMDRLNGSIEARIRPTTTDFLNRQRMVLPLFERLARKYSAGVVWPHTALCDEQTCRVEVGGTPLYTDDNHLTVTAAKSLSAIFSPVFLSERL